MFRQILVVGMFALTAGTPVGAQAAQARQPPATSELPVILGAVERRTATVGTAQPGQIVPAPESLRIVRIPLDRTGITDWRFRNPREPHRLCVSVGQNGECKTDDSGDDVLLRFENLSSTRTMVIEFTEIPETRKRDVEAAGLTNLTCVGDKCEAVRHIPSGLTRLEVPIKALYAAYVGASTGNIPRIQFKVSLFEEDIDLANSIGVFTLLPRDRTAERAEPTKWATTAAADALWGPDLSGLVPPCAEAAGCSTEPRIGIERPRADAMEEHFSGTVRLGITQSIGDRARAEAEIQLKKGNFGAEDPSVQVTATKYRIYVFAANGTTISGGRYAFAAPSQGIAINEAGEGVTVSWRRAEFSHIFKKEVPDDRLRRALIGLTPGDRSIANGDDHATLLQIRDIGLSDGRGVRLNVLALRGLQETHGLDYEYWTLGGEAFAGFTRNVSGSVAAYQSSREADVLTESGEAGRSGHVWLATLSYTKFLPALDDREREMLSHGVQPMSLSKSKKQRLEYTLTAFAGRGTGDNRRTPEREDYLGQTNAFFPDVIFLGSLAPFVALPDADGTVGKGLANKFYLSAAYNHHYFSPLRWLARILRVGEDIESEGTTIRVHHYRFNERVFGRYDAGNEINVEFRIESPKGVKYKTVFAVYKPGKALSSIITKTQYAALGNVSVRF